MRRINYFLMCALLLSPLDGRTEPSGTTSFLRQFNQEAAASDASGIMKYSEDLIGLIDSDAPDKDLVHLLSKRLANAEQRARAGRGKLVPEAAIAHSFDDLMKGIGAPIEPKADVTQIRKFRERSVTAPDLSALLTAGRNGTNCNPGEAVLLLYLLIINNGQLVATSSDFAKTQEGRTQSSKLVETTGGAYLGSLDQLSTYIAKHSKRDVRNLFDHLAQTLNF